MENYAKPLKKLLATAGWEFLRTAKDDHDIWWNPKTGQKLTIDAGSKSRHLANDLLKAVGLPKSF
jgi:hypothetical protein